MVEATETTDFFSQGQDGYIFLSMISLRIYFCCCLFCFETRFLSVALAVLEDQADLELRDPAASGALGLKVCATTFRAEDAVL